MPSGRDMFLSDDTGLQRVQVQPANSLADMLRIGAMNQHYRNQEALQQQELEIKRQHQALEEQRAQHQLFRDTYALSQDPRLTANPEAQDALFGALGKMAGVPELSAESMKLGRNSLKGLYKSALTGDPNQTADAYAELAVRVANPQDLEKITGAFSQFELVREKTDAVRIHRQVEELKYTQLQDSTVKAEVGRTHYAPASMDFRDALRGTETKEYQQVLSGVDSILKKSSGASGSAQAIQDLLIRNKFPQFSKENSAQLAATYSEKRQQFAAMADTSTKILDDVNHGAAGLSFAGKAELTHRVAVGRELADAYGALEAWAGDPFNRSKLKAAQHAGRTIEEQRLAMEKLQVKNDQTAVQLRQDALSFRQSEAGQKHLYEQSVAHAQVKFASLPSDQQTPQAAASIAQSIQQESGVLVKPQDILMGKKDPNAPQSVNKTEVHVGDKAGVKLAENAMENLKESHVNAMGATDILDGVVRINSAISKGNVTLGPGATIRNSIGQVANLLGVQGKTEEERLVNTRETIRGLAQFAVNARKLLRGQGQVTENEQKLLIRAESGEINDFTLPELKSFLTTTERLANKSISNHQRMMDVARKKPELQGYLDFYELPSQPASRDSGGKASPSKGAPSKQSGPSLKALPEGSTQIGTSNGKPVYQSPDGKKWIGD